MKSFRFLILLTFIFAQLSLAISSIVMAGPLQLRGFRDPQSEPQIFIIEVPTKYRTPQQERLLLEALAHLSGYKKHLKVTFSRTRIEFDTYVVSFAANSSVQAPYRIKDMVPWPIQIRSIKDIFLGNRSHTPGPLPIMKMDAATLLETYKKSALEERVALMRSLSGTVLLSPTKSFHIRSGIPQKIEEVKEELTEIIDLTLEQIGKISTSIDQLVSRDVLSLDRKNLEDTLRTGLILRHTIMPFTNKASRNEIAAVTTAQFQFFSFLPIAQQKIYFRKLLNKYFSRPNTQPSIDSNAFAALAAKDRNERLALSSEVLRVWQVLS
ncbi:MAG TPA: hypothetical protein PLU50_09495, partial [Pseudobdellovibrionaceae bacterium]|nr:hypothetical protein [Pseudobdellovibrionaceae bacterium]